MRKRHRRLERLKYHIGAANAKCDDHSDIQDKSEKDMKGKRYYLYGMVLLTAVISAVALSGCSSSGAQKRTGLKKVAIAGGVSANKRLREVFDEIFTPLGVKVYYPKLCYCTDNVAMIGGACYFMIKKGIKQADMSLDAKANVKLG